MTLSGLFAAGIIGACIFVPMLLVLAVWLLIPTKRERDAQKWFAAHEHWLAKRRWTTSARLDAMTARWR